MLKEVSLVMDWEIDIGDGTPSLRRCSHTDGNRPIRVFRTPQYQSFFCKAGFYDVDGSFENYNVRSLNNCWLSASAFTREDFLYNRNQVSVTKEVFPTNVNRYLDNGNGTTPSLRSCSSTGGNYLIQRFKRPHISNSFVNEDLAISAVI